MELKGVHFILTYMCNFECDHCFLFCRPDAKGVFTIDQIRNVLEECRKIGTVESICFEGGEPFLYHPLLCESVKLAHEKGFETAIETNTYWATTEEDAELWLKPLKSAGLSTIEVSDDTFHHGEKTDNSAKRALAAAKKMGLNVNSICIKKPQVQESGEQEKGKPIYLGGPKLRGRAAQKLIEGLPTKSYENFTECSREDLRNPDRVHIDSFGHVHLCQGLSMGNMWETPLSDLVNNYNPDAHPISGPMLKGGPSELAREYNLEHEDEYVDACHMCSMMCRALIDRFPNYIAPRQVYGLE
jgi:organic radical activating enzyme